MITPVLSEFNLVYIFSRDAHPGLLKIGKVSVKAYQLSDITEEQMKNAYLERYKGAGTLAITDMRILHIEVASFYSTKQQKNVNFIDEDVRDVILNSHFKNVKISTPFGEAEEWYEIDLQNAIKAIKAVKKEKSFIENANTPDYIRPNIVFRDEQQRAVCETLNHFAAGNKMLWNAKMRFGKTLCTLELVRQAKYKKVLILTHRPTVKSGWFEDFHDLNLSDYLYGSKDGTPNGTCKAWMEDDKKKYDAKGKDFKTLFEGVTPYIYFASMQDLRGSKYIFGEEEKNKKGEKRGFEKNDEVFENDWDLIVLDEAHEGTQTELGKRVIKNLKENEKSKKNLKLLYLSGTPYNILNQFDANSEVFTWDYVMEQEAKTHWIDKHPGERNPYEGLAKMHIYTYDLNEVYAKNNHVYTEDDFFSFSEFFRVYKAGDEITENGVGKAVAKDLVGHFVHEEDVRHFLDLLCDNTQENYYPFSSDALCSVLKHTFWLVPGVAQASALEAMIEQHKLHTDLGFEVVNVAGNGKSIAEIESVDDTGAGKNIGLEKAEEQEKDALNKVKKAVKKHNRTITLSCGRLTTGVSVPEWTGVFMLAGGYRTGAAAYMQAIFRGQTPYKDGSIKHDCYAFDFAPDRTLTVVDEYIKMQPIKKATFNNPLPNQQTANVSNASIQAIMHHLPVIAMKGGQEIEYNAQTFVMEVNSAYTNYFREHGLRGRKLTRDFATFTPEDHKLLDTIGKMFSGGTPKLNADGTLQVADSGLSGENGSNKKTTNNKQSGNKEPKNEPKTKRVTEDESEQRRNSQSVLDLIYARLPLLIFGAVEDTDNTTIDNLLSEEIIDQVSWEEFMPKKFTKTIFRQIEHLIKTDALIAYAVDIVNDAKSADSLPVEKRILKIAKIIQEFHFPDKETVLTPWRVVNMHMADTIGGYDFYDEEHKKVLETPRFVRQEVTDEIFAPDSKVLEVNSKSGVYPLWLAYNFWRFRKTQMEKVKSLTEEESRTLWDDIIANQVFVLCKTPMAVKITHRALAGYDKSLTTNCKYQPHLLDEINTEEGRKQFANTLKTFTYWNIKNMKIDSFNFNAVVGNPPYQQESADNNRNLPLYHLFVNLACDIKADYVSLITPARWYTGSILLGDFTERMLRSDRHVAKLYDFSDASYCFPQVEIKGGVCYFLMDSSYSGDCEVTSYHNDAHMTIKRPLKSSYGDFFIRSNESVSIINKVNVNKEHNFSNIVSSQNPFGFNSKVVGNASATGKKDEIVILSKFQTKGYIDRKKVKLRSEWIDLWKVMTPIAGEGSALPNRVTGKPFISEPGQCCNGTYMVIGPVGCENEANNLVKYLYTKFVRFLVSTIQLTQNTKSDSYQLVPLQDFTSNSDIDWNKSVEEIDEQLFTKYKLTSDEIAYIKSVIKPMN